MKIKMELVFAEMGDGFVAVPVGDNARHIVIRFNETGANICKAIMDGLSKEQIKDKLLEEYDGVEEETALKAVEKTVAILKAEGIIEE